jgi:type IV pilus biogenesis protein CpaD/CtpE
MKKIVLLFAVVASIAACAKRPEAITPNYVSPMEYDGATCEQLRMESSRVSRALVMASEQQSRARSNDILGVVFLWMPVSSFTGDNISHYVADLKGREETIQRKLTMGECR